MLQEDLFSRAVSLLTSVSGSYPIKARVRGGFNQTKYWHGRLHLTRSGPAYLQGNTEHDDIGGIRGA